MLTIHVECAPGKSRPRMRTTRVHADLIALKKRLGVHGIGGLTEFRPMGYRDQVRKVFGKIHRQMPRVADTPILWTGGWQQTNGGRDMGSRGVPLIAPSRFSVWAVLRMAHHDGQTYKVGVVSFHTIPGGWSPAGRLTPYRRAKRYFVQRRWNTHARRIERRQRMLAKRCDVVVSLGDINRPGLLTLGKDKRLSTRGIVYVGLQHAPGVQVAHDAARHHRQHADHSAQSVALRITKEGKQRG